VGELPFSCVVKSCLRDTEVLGAILTTTTNDNARYPHIAGEREGGRGGNAVGSFHYRYQLRCSDLGSDCLIVPLVPHSGTTATRMDKS
jgi:hypothetical protein